MKLISFFFCCCHIQSLVSQDRLLDAAKVTLEVVRLQRAASKSDPSGVLRASKIIPLHYTLQSLLWHLGLQSERNAEGIDQGRHPLDVASGTDAIAAIALHCLQRFDALAGSTNDLRKVKAAQKDANSFREIELLLKWFRLQQPRHPAQIAAVYEAVRSAVTGHARGAELLQVLDVARTERMLQQEKENDEDAKDVIFHAARSASKALQRAKSTGSVFLFKAYTYNGLEMHDNDSEREDEYLKATRK